MNDVKSGLALSRLSIHVVLLLVGLLFLLPFLWMIVTALKPPQDVFELTPSFIPSELRWGNFVEAFTSQPFPRYYLNTVIMTVGRVGVQLFICSMAAFAFARLRFPGRDLLFLLLLAALMVPPQMTIIPNFIIMRYFGWIDTYAGLIVPTLFSAFGTFLLRQFFMTVPSALQEAAVLEGANPFQIYRYIFLPLARSALAAFALIQILWSWNDFLWPLIVTGSSDMRVLSVAIALFQTAESVNITGMMAAATMATVPMLIVFLLAQRQLIEGISLSGLK